MQTYSCPIRTRKLVRMILLVKASLTIMALCSTSEWEGRGDQDREFSKSSKTVNPPRRAGPHHLRPQVLPYSCAEDYANEERAFCQKPWLNPTIFKAVSWDRSVRGSVHVPVMPFLDKAVLQRISLFEDSVPLCVSFFWKHDYKMFHHRNAFCKLKKNCREELIKKK